jgi:nucleotide-binding universal stress UspA family protein
VEVTSMPLIIVGVDGSEQSERALSWARAEAALLSATVQAVTVVDTRTLAEDEREQRLATAELMLADMVSRVCSAQPGHVNVTYEVLEGDPMVVLVDATRRAEFIVFGSHQQTSIRNPALSTVSLACIRMGHCPVLVIPVGVREPELHADLVPA